MSQGNLAAAEDFIREAGTMRSYLQTLDVTYQGLFHHIQSQNVTNAVEAIDRFRQILTTELEKELGNLEKALAEVYAERFSPEELVEMKAFFKTQVGQKLIQSTSIIAHAFSEKTLDFQEKMANVILPKIQMTFKMEGFNL